MSTIEKLFTIVNNLKKKLAQFCKIKQLFKASVKKKKNSKIK